MVCKSCGLDTHQRTSSRLCPNFSPRESKKPPQQGARQTHVRVYKTGLNQFVKPDYHLVVVEKIHELVPLITQICFEASQLLHLYVASKIAGSEQLPENLYDENFLRQFFATIIYDGKEGKAEEDVLITYHHVYKPCRDITYGIEMPNKIGQMLTYVVKNYSVVLKLHVTQHVDKFFSAYLLTLFIDEFGWEKALSHRRCDAIMEKSKDDKFYAEHADLLVFRTKYDEITKTVDSRLRYCHFRNNQNVQYNLSCELNKKQRKLYNLIPLYTTQAKYITIDSDGLYDLLGKDHFDGLDRKSAGQHQVRYWTKFFNIPERLLEKSMFKRTFAFMIETDGVGVSVMTSRWLPKDEEIASCETKEERRKIYEKREKRRKVKAMRKLKALAEQDDVEWIGMDPGRITIQTAYRSTVYEDFTSHRTTNVKKLSSDRYYTESQFRQRTKKVKLYQQRANLTNFIAQIPSTKYGSAEGIISYLTYIFKDNKLQDWVKLNCTHQYRKLRWRVYIHNQKTVLNFCRETLGPDIDYSKTIVCMGDAKFKHNSKGNATTPTNKRFLTGFRQLGAHPFLTCEYNTSQVCSNCLTEVRLAKCKYTSDDHGVRECTVKTCRTKWNRDVNAAHNMIETGKSQILLGERRAPFDKTLPCKNAAVPIVLVGNTTTSMGA